TGERAEDAQEFRIAYGVGIDIGIVHGRLEIDVGVTIDEPGSRIKKFEGDELNYRCRESCPDIGPVLRGCMHKEKVLRENKGKHCSLDAAIAQQAGRSL